MKVEVETKFDIGDSVYIAIWSNTIREFDIKSQAIKSIRIEYTDAPTAKIYYNGYLQSLTFASWSDAQTAIKTNRI